jgi:FkbM family methyltransferase
MVSLRYVFALAWLKIAKPSPQTVTRSGATRFFELVDQDASVDFIASHVRLSETASVLDIGANSGFFSKAILERFPKFRGRVVLVEPIANLSSISVAVLEQFKCEKVFINAAVGLSIGEVELMLPLDGNIGWVTGVVEKADPRSQKIRVRKVSSRDLVRIYRPDFVKIDVEGMEAEILEGMISELHPEYLPALFVEVGWGRSHPRWARFLEVASRLDDLGYRAWSTDGVRLSLDEISRLDKTTDLLFVSVP